MNDTAHKLVQNPPVILHLNDNNLLLQQGDKISRSQGYAWLLDGQVYFDLESAHNAPANCRLEPQQINSLYWQQCAQTAIASNDSGMRHAADLIWRHLSDLKKAFALDSVVLVVPSHYQASNLQLLLGVANAANLQVAGLINKAVLALAGQVQSEGNYLHVDVQLHQTVCSEVLAKDGWLSLRKIEVLHEVGLQAMQDSLLRAIQQRFILSDRFDPLHYAETEQQLFAQLSLLSRHLMQDGKANVSVEYQGRQHATSIDVKQWNSALEHYLAPLLFAQVESKVAHRFYDFNGFQVVDLIDATHSQLQHNASVLRDQASMVQEFVSTASRDDQGELIYCTGLAMRRAPSSAEHQPSERQPYELNGAQDKAIRPLSSTDSVSSSDRLATGKTAADLVTHLLQAGIAVPIQYAHIDIGQNVLRLSHSTASNVMTLLAKQKIFIVGDNHRRILQVNDRLGSELAEGVITVIQVLQENRLESSNKILQKEPEALN